MIPYNSRPRHGPPGFRETEHGRGRGGNSSAPVVWQSCLSKIYGGSPALPASNHSTMYSCWYLLYVVCTFTILIIQAVFAFIQKGKLTFTRCNRKVNTNKISKRPLDSDRQSQYRYTRYGVATRQKLLLEFISQHSLGLPNRPEPSLVLWVWLTSLPTHIRFPWFMGLY